MPVTRTEAQGRGDAAETIVAAHLEAAGWTILGRQVRVGRRELDLVALDPGPPAALVAVEVRWRGRRDFGLAEETFDRRKRGHVVAALLGLIATGRLPGGAPLPRLAVRVDLVVVEPPGAPGGGVRLRHHRAAAGG